MSNYRRKPAQTKGPPRRDPLASLKMADMMILKPIFPAAILEQIVDHLDVPDLVRFAGVSRRMQEMVYDDTRWNKRLRRMGCWNENEARKNAERPKEDSHQYARSRRRSTIDNNKTVNGKGRTGMLVNGDVPSPTSPRQAAQSDGFDTISFGSQPIQQGSRVDGKESALSILKSAQSIRGRSRQEYGRIYRVLAPFCKDALNSISPTTSMIFRIYTAPEQQAQMLKQVQTFVLSDFSPGAEVREQKLKDLANMFGTAALLEFRKGYEYKDIQGRMRQYAHVMHILDGGQNSVDLFLNDNRLISQKSKLGTVSDCVDYSLGYGQLSLERVQAYFERLGEAYSQESAIVQAAFPDPGPVLLSLLEKVAEEILAPFLAALFQDARTRGTSIYLRVISGTLAATKQFIQTYTLPAEPDDEAMKRANDVMIKIYEPHMEVYLVEELNFFKQKADKEVEQWDQALSEQAASTETFLMSNVNRQGDKKDFMSSFKKVVMMPVNILPKISGSSSNKPKNSINGDAHLGTSVLPSRSVTPNPFTSTRSGTPTLPVEAPTTELAAKAALMTSRLEGIKSLFSMEVALNLVHAAKSSLERSAQFASLGGEVGEEARKQCATIYVMLLDTVGNRHIRVGFDKAVNHLSIYNPRDANTNKIQDSQQSYNQPTVAPLTTFVELVNVGDLIQQMLDVFFESELIAYGICRRDDFLDPPVKEKRKFEAMLDEHVAVGLGKGIDVLMDEVEYICATEQQPTDYNPAIAMFDASAPNTRPASMMFHSSTSHNTASAPIDIDISPTPTCNHIVSLIRTHHTLLIGTTDKTLLDVFTSELSLRLFQTLTKHIKRQRISPLGAIRLLSDLTQYSSFVASFKNAELNQYFNALREVSQIFLIEGKTDKELDEMSGVISDAGRYSGVFGVEEVVEFVERRSDWFAIRSKVEGRIRGESCLVM